MLKTVIEQLDSDDTLIIIDSKKLDEAIIARRKVDKCKN